MLISSPRTAPEALRLIRSTEAAAALDFMLYATPSGTEIESFKTDAEGNRSRRYALDMFRNTCTCPDFRQYGQFCKHLILLEGLMRKAQEEEQAEQAAEQEDGRLLMEFLHDARRLR